jgi:hypothetical protein
MEQPPATTLGFLRFFFGAGFFVLLVYFITQVSGGLYGSLNISRIGRAPTCHLPQEDCCTEKNQVILLHTLLLLACCEKPIDYAPAGAHAAQ